MCWLVNMLYTIKSFKNIHKPFVCKTTCIPKIYIKVSKNYNLSTSTREFLQIFRKKSPFLESYLHKVDAKTHTSPLCPLCNMHTHDTHHFFNCTHIRTTLSPQDLCTDPAGVTALLVRWTEKLAGGPQAGTSDSPTSKGHGSR